MPIISFRSAIISENSHKKLLPGTQNKMRQLHEIKVQNCSIKSRIIIFSIIFFSFFCSSFSRYHFFGIEVHCSRTEISIFSHFFVLMYFHLQQESNRLRVPIWYGLSHEFMVSRMKAPQLQRHFESRLTVEVKWRSWR